MMYSKTFITQQEVEKTYWMMELLTETDNQDYVEFRHGIYITTNFNTFIIR